MKIKKSHATLALRLGIPLEKLKDPNVVAAFDEHLKKCKQILEEPVPLNLSLPPKPPGAISRIGASNRIKQTPEWLQKLYGEKTV
jgi:hypothetical protein